MGVVLFFLLMRCNAAAPTLQALSLSPGWLKLMPSFAPERTTYLVEYEGANPVDVVIQAIPTETISRLIGANLTFSISKKTFKNSGIGTLARTIAVLGVNGEYCFYSVIFQNDDFEGKDPPSPGEMIAILAGTIAFLSIAIFYGRRIWWQRVRSPTTAAIPLEEADL